MKKLGIILVICTLFISSVAFAASKVVELKQWDFMAQVATQSKGNLFVYKVVDPDNKAVCYVMASDDIKWGSSPSISCIK